MTITERTAQELAELLPDNLDCSDARKRLLSLIELLRAVTDYDHPLSNADIRAVLVAKLGEGTAPSENTLNADIKALREQGVLGYEVHTGTRGTWCENGAFTPASVRLCLNAVQSSRFLTSDQSTDVQNALGTLVSCWREDELAYEVHVTQQVREGAEVLERCDAIARALRENRMVEFEYAYNDFKGKQKPLSGDDGNTLRVETPIALIFSEGNYYLESYSDPAWRHCEKLMRSRLDRMTMLRVSSRKALECAEVRKLRRSAARRMRRDFDMFSGAPRIVFLRVHAYMTNEMIDRFGFGLRYGQFEGEIGDRETSGVTCVRVSESGTFCRWLAGTGGGVQLVRPPMGATAPRSTWSSVCKGRSVEELEADFEAMAQYYRAFLGKAAQSCHVE